MNKQPRQNAFTVVELIVAVGITVLMLLLINTLFNDTSRAVSSGIGLSDIIGNERAMVNQIAVDTNRMQGPNSSDPSGAGGGILMIHNAVIPMVTYSERGGKEAVRDIRADAFLFIAKRTGDDVLTFQPTAPGTSSSYDPIAPEKLNGSTNFVRIYYGHGIVTLPDGSPGAVTVADNGLANNWPLVRHALFIVPRDTSSPPVPPADPDPFHPHDTTGFIRATGPYYDSAVVGFTTPIPGATLRDAYTDLVDMDYSASAVAHPNGALFGDNSTAGTALIYANASPGVKESQANYAAAAKKLMFSGNNRMRTNLRPGIVDRTDPYKPELVAQMHNLLAVNVSDFIVEFAADADFDNQIDVDGSGNIRWYGAIEPPVWNTGGAGAPAIFFDPNPQAAGDPFVFRHDYKAHWPYMLRIRYRLHDPRASILSEDPGETSPGAPGEGTKNGKWFEHIVRVERGT